MASAALPFNALRLAAGQPSGPELSLPALAANCLQSEYRPNRLRPFPGFLPVMNDRSPRSLATDT